VHVVSELSQRWVGESVSAGDRDLADALGFEVAVDERPQLPACEAGGLLSERLKEVSGEVGAVAVGSGSQRICP
jgi:hypothetical protein